MESEGKRFGFGGRGWEGGGGGGRKGKRVLWRRIELEPLGLVWFGFVWFCFVSTPLRRCLKTLLY